MSKRIRYYSEKTVKRIISWVCPGTYFIEDIVDRIKRAKHISIPVNHGRIADLDVIRKKLSEDCPCRGCENYREEGVCMQCQWDRFVDLIDNAPVIVEASE